MKTIVLISGKMQSGKNQFAEYLSNDLKFKQKRVRTDLFAASLKRGCSEDFKFATAQINAVVAEVKDLINSTWLNDTYNLIAAKKLLDQLTVTKEANWYEDKTIISRLLLQTYGTEIFRNRIDTNYWVNQVIDRAFSSDEEFTLVTDARFENEITHVVYRCESEPATQLAKVVTIRINRNMKMNDLYLHDSENGLDNFTSWDHVINNNGTLDDLKKAAKVVTNSILGDKHGK